MAYQWVYEKATGEFVYGGPYVAEFKEATQAMVAFAEHEQPDPRRERFDSGPSNKRPATAQEIAAYDEATLDAEASNATNGASLAFTALRRWTLEQVNLLRAAVVPPLPAMTEAAQLADLKAKYKTEKTK